MQKWGYRQLRIGVFAVASSVHLHPVVQKLRSRFRRVSPFELNILIPFFFDLILPGSLRWIGFGLTVLFIAVYVVSQRGHDRVKIPFIIAQIALLLVMAAWLNIGYFWSIFFPATSIGFMRSNKLSNILAALLVGTSVLGGAVISLVQHLPAPDWILFLAAEAAGIGAIYGIRAQKKVLESRASLEQANEAIEHLTKQAERERISRDLHDVLGHELSMITVKAQLAERLLDKDVERAKQEIVDIQQAARQALEQVRDYITDIRQVSLSGEIRHAQRGLKAAGIRCAVTGFAEINSFEASVHGHQSSTVQRQLNVASLCIREAVTNVVRHSTATLLEMNLVLEETMLHISIADNGIGFPAHIVGNLSTSRGHGLRGMATRVAEAGGHFDLSSATGAVVTIQIPVPNMP